MKKTLLELSKKEGISTKQKRYQRITGSIMLFIVEARLNIAFAIFIVSQFRKKLFLLIK